MAINFNVDSKVGMGTLKAKTDVFGAVDESMKKTIKTNEDGSLNVNNQGTVLKGDLKLTPEQKELVQQGAQAIANEAKTIEKANEIIASKGISVEGLTEKVAVTVKGDVKNVDIDFTSL